MWVYDDPELHDMVLLWLFDYRFNLADLDEWIESPDTAKARRGQLLGWRQRAIDAQRGGNEDAAEGWVMYLRTLLELHARQRVLIPHVEADLRHRRSQAERASQGGKLTERERRRMVEQYALRVRDGQRYGAIKALAAAFDVSERTVRSIVAPKRNRK